MSQQETEPGLDVLNVGAGHVEIRFGKKDPVEVDRAKRMITDMLKRGYVLFVEGKGKELQRVRSFDAKAGVYYVSDVADVEEAAGDTVTSDLQPTLKKGRPPKAVPMEKAKATAIGRSAGG